MKILFAVTLGFLLSLVCWKLFTANKNEAAAEHFDDATRSRSHRNQVNKAVSALEHYDDFEDADEDDFDDESYESEFLDAYEHYKKKLPAPAAKKAAYSKLRAKHGKKFTNSMANKLGAPGKNKPGAVGKNPFYDASAQFDITVTRNGVLIAKALPVPLFASIHFDAKYISILGNYLPAGVTLSAIAVAADGSLTLSYTEGANTDTVTVSCAQIPYITFLNALNNTQMQFSKVRYSISDVTKLQQFNQPFETSVKTLFGKYSGENLSLAAVNDPKNTNLGVRDLDNDIDVNNETAVIIGIINVAAFSVCISSFVRAFARNNR